MENQNNSQNPENIENSENLKNLEGILGYEFKNKELARSALVHSSFTNENKAKGYINNERLEYLGDAVLELITSEYIYLNFPDMSEGEMTKLRASIVCEPTLAKKAGAFRLGHFMKMGKGEIANKGQERDSILCDALEALIGALYLDGGMFAARDFILSQLEEDIHNQQKFSWTNDCKTYLQEQLQKTGTLPIEYYVVGEKGPDHEKTFTIELSHGGRALAQGSGRNKKEAEQKAACQAILKLGLDKN